jgi:hypothetical protein
MAADVAQKPKRHQRERQRRSSVNQSETCSLHIPVRPFAVFGDEAVEEIKFVSAGSRKPLGQRPPLTLRQAKEFM